MKHIVWIMCLWLLASCSESREEAMLRLVNEWKDKSVIIPVRSVFTVQGKDVVDFNYRDAEYKILVYTDSVGCTSCKLQLPKWKRMIAEVDSLTGGSVPFLFYFHPKDPKELRFYLRRDNFTYPVCFEEDDYINRLNRFPSDMTFQTMLLNKENKVVAIGSPVLNPKIKDLYLEIITGKKRVGADKSVTTVSMDQSEKNFGNIPLNEKREHIFKLVNMGNKPLVIYDVVTSCGCTKAEYGKEPVRPGETLELKVIYNAEDKGRFRKNLTVYCNAEDSPLKLTVVGVVE
ncbi:MAG: DUF1573 domain-containing protein [Bacteroidaceae bacterium]|nr:DUF1573 domain-containing protein [Bacteroidaceae bacterium]